jgi:hypothetical protein
MDNTVGTLVLVTGIGILQLLHEVWTIFFLFFIAAL